MINFLHTFQPRPILATLGPIHIYWYGLLMVSGILAAILVCLRLARFYDLKKEMIFDLSFWLIIFGLIGARVYDDFLQLPYYWRQPLDALKIWQGGLAIHGAIIAGLIVIFVFARRRKINFWRLTALITPGLALAQTIGRWGNYFNQELFGRPTALPWGLPIAPEHRPPTFMADSFFQPTFLYESLGCLFIFLILFSLNLYFIKRQRLNERIFVWLTALYMILYSILRFALEFLRLDETPIFLSWRWPQIISLLLIILALLILIFNPHASRQKTD